MLLQLQCCCTATLEASMTVMLTRKHLCCHSKQQNSCLCSEMLTFAHCWHSASSWGPNCSCDGDAQSQGVSSRGVCSHSASQVPCCFCAGASERCPKAPFLRGWTPPGAMQTGCPDHQLPAVPAAAPRAECQHPEHHAHAHYRVDIVHCCDMLHQTMKCVGGSR